MRTTKILTMGIALLITTLLTGCMDQFVKRDEFNSTVDDLRSTDASLENRLENQLNDMTDLFSELSGQLNRKFEGYDARIAAVQGRLRVEMTAHFAYDDASLRDVDKPSLDQFTDVIRDHHSNVIVTVEGFTDPAGDAKYNQWLGLERAKAVRDYLVQIGGLNPDNVRAVSYGEQSQRQIRPNAWGDEGGANRRVALVIDYVASQEAP